MNSRIRLLFIFHFSIDMVGLTHIERGLAQSLGLWCWSSINWPALGSCRRPVWWNRRYRRSRR